MRLNIKGFKPGMMFQRYLTGFKYLICQDINPSENLFVIDLCSNTIFLLDQAMTDNLINNCFLLNPELEDYVYESGDVIRTKNNHIIVIEKISNRHIYIMEIDRELTITQYKDPTLSSSINHRMISNLICSNGIEIRNDCTQWKYIGKISDFINFNDFLEEKNK